MDTDRRLPEFQRDATLESLLAELNALVRTCAVPEATGFRTPTLPTLFVVGCARSGTTLLTQWLAASGQFAYPTNVVSRLYEAPRVGALLHRVLVELDTRNEIVPDECKRIDFASSLGKARGASQPHEFWYWWRRFFRFGEIQRISPEELERVDRSRFLHELWDLESVFGRPVAMKAMILNWNLDFLSELVPGALFLHVTRGEISNARSLLAARQRFYGDPARWYSFKPPEYPLVRDAAPEVQVAAQVLATNAGVERGLAAVSSERVQRVSYEAFCATPEAVWRELRDRLVAHPSRFELPPYAGPDRFDAPADERAIEPEERAVWAAAFAEARRLLGDRAGAP